MKILHVINSLATGGAEKLIVETVPLYYKEGLEVDVLLLNGVESPFLKELQSKKCCTVFSLGKGSVYNPLLIFKIIPYLKQYEIVHVHLFPALYWVVLAKILKKSSVKLMYTEHSTTNKRRNYNVFKNFDRIIYKFYDKIITIASEVDKNIKAYLGFLSAKFYTINNGVDTDFIHKAKPYLKEDFFLKGDKILIQISSFREPKDQSTLIKSLTLLPEKIKLVLVGEGELKDTCEDLVDQLKLKHRVKFLGIRMDVPELLKTSDIIVLSSKHEGLSLSSVEGMASGKPFIASDVPGLTEVVKDAGLLFPQGDEKALATAILSLINDKDLYDSVVKKCLQRASQYDIHKMVDKHIKLYNSLFIEHN